MKKLFLLFLFAVSLFLSSCGIDPSQDTPIVVDESKCIGMECRICEQVCKFDAIHFYGSNSVPIIDPAKCTGCGECVEECPTKALSGRR
jgi:NAD-dependent dihydropyrimidine dehydrogenase PreA subunit